MYQDLSTRHDWLVKKAIVDLLVRLKENSKLTSGNSLSPLGAQNKDHRQQQQQNFINKQNKCTEVLPAASKAIRGGTMRAKYKNKDYGY